MISAAQRETVSSFSAQPERALDTLGKMWVLRMHWWWETTRGDHAAANDSARQLDVVRKRFRRQTDPLVPIDKIEKEWDHWFRVWFKKLRR